MALASTNLSGFGEQVLPEALVDRMQNEMRVLSRNLERSLGVNIGDLLNKGKGIFGWLEKLIFGVIQ